MRPRFSTLSASTGDVSPSLLVDVTQYASWPARSGIQRVLANLAAEWPGKRVSAHFGFLDDGAFVVGPLRPLGERIRESFARGHFPPGPDTEHELLRSVSTARVATGSIEESFDGYLLPEPTLDAASIAVAERLQGSRRTSSFLLYFDPLPMTRPELFPHAADASLTVTRYHLLAARAANVAFISDAVRQEFETRLARKRVPNPLVARPGVTPSASHEIRPSPRRFAMIGTVEPRKGHRVVLDALEQAWDAGADYELVLLGPPGWAAPELLERIDGHTRTRRVVWHRDPGDEAIWRSVESCAGLLFPSEAEGYGLPPLEALARRCPVVVSAGLPSVQGLPAAGQIRLQEVTTDSVRAALDTLADPRRNVELRDSIEGLELPTWARFARDVEDWVFHSIAAQRPTAAA
jgi:glycosyltransferase involved in cell wall biosynthesis